MRKLDFFLRWILVGDEAGIVALKCHFSPALRCTLTNDVSLCLSTSVVASDSAIQKPLPLSFNDIRRSSQIPSPKLNVKQVVNKHLVDLAFRMATFICNFYLFLFSFLHPFPFNISIFPPSMFEIAFTTVCDRIKSGFPN